MSDWNSKARTKPKFIKAVKVGDKTYTTPHGAAGAWADYAQSRHHERLRDAGVSGPAPCCILTDRGHTWYDQNGPRQTTVKWVTGCNVYNRLRRRALKIFKNFFTN